jgi:hypothetical protein
VWIRYRGNVSTEPLPSSDSRNSTEPLPSNDEGIFTEPLPSNHKGTRRLMGGSFNQAVEMGSGAVTYVLSFIKIGSGVQKLIKGIHRHTDSNVIS